MDDAVKLHLEGRLQEAEAIYRRILQAWPANLKALHLLGVIALQQRRFDEATELISRAIAFNKRIPEFHNNLGNVYWGQGMVKEAEACYRRALKLNSKYADARNNMGNVLKHAGKFEEALSSYNTALRFDPNRAEIHNNAGMILDILGRYDDAIGHYREAVRLKPDFCDAYSNMGAALKAQGKLPETIDSCAKALAINPKHGKALFNMGNAYAQGGNLERGIHYYRQALQEDPNLCEAHLNLGHALHEEGHTEEAAIHLKQSLVLKPDSLGARFGHCIRQIPLIHDSVDEIAAARNNYRRELEQLCESLDLTDPELARKAAQIVGNCQPFFLAYQGQNDRELQSLYGDLMVRIQSARFPAWSKKKPMPSHPPGEPLRIGFVSGFYFLHSNWKIPIKGWVSNLNREEFQLFGYYTGRTIDAQTEIARKSFYRFREGFSSMEQWCESISGDRLHALIFPEVGMDPMTVRLASLRLAPIQCASWGHPDTSGLPTIDYYLSSELMEPTEADEHYSERLVRLPKLSIYYEPLSMELPSVNRSDLGLRDNSVLFLCVQSLFKYLPQLDDVFPRIAREVGDCQFAFLSFAKSGYLGKRFVRRLEKAFSRYGLRYEDYVRFLPHLTPPHYQALNRLADVFLDSIGWSGCNSTLEAMAHDLPIVTLPGDLMRGRHSYAILTMAGIHEMIAQDIDQYVSLAVRLGTDSNWRRQISEKISRLKSKVYCDTDCIRGLEDFLKQAVSSYAQT
jgi:predicted O-linked N-acetylglucosamine transferase (SPINDLY family)